MRLSLTSFVFVSLLSAVFSITIEVKGFEGFCLFSEFPANDQYSGSYVGSGYDEKNMMLQIFSPSNQLVFLLEQHKEGSFNINTTEGGEYKTCFRNNVKENLFVTFEIRSNSTEAKGIALEQGQVTSMIPEMKEVMTDFYRVRAGLTAQQMRGRVHTDNLNSLNSKIQWITFFKILIVSLVASGQLYVIQGLFQKKARAFV